MASRDTSPTKELADAIAEFYNDPLGYVMFIFPWDKDPAIQVVLLAEGPDDRNAQAAREAGEEKPSPMLSDADRERQQMYRDMYPTQEFGPDLWACDFLSDLGEELKKREFGGRIAVDPIQFATASGHGIGKSVLVAWLVKFILDTRPNSKGVVTAGTADQLKTKTWAEVGKWHYLSLTADWFKYTSGRGAMTLRHRNPRWKDWRCDAQTCREENSESFAGQHAAGASSFFIFDEASGVPTKIFEVRDGGTTDGAPMVFDFGNPTRNSGRFFEECVGKLRHRYHVRCIDSRQVAITNKERINQWIEDYGEDSDYVKVRVRGIFPSMGAVQFISSGSVADAQARELFDDPHAPLVIGVDVARYGDDESVVLPRIGNDVRSFPAQRYRKLDTVQLTGKVIEMVREFRALGRECKMIYVDGGGIGGGVVDQLRHLNYPVTEVQFGGAPTDNMTYRYKCDEIWGNMRDAIRDRLCLPAEHAENGIDMRQGLTQREFGYTITGNKIHLETKDDMKKRGLDSPDLQDALAVTYASELAPASSLLPNANPNKMVSDFDPFVTKQPTPHMFDKYARLRGNF